MAREEVYLDTPEEHYEAVGRYRGPPGRNGEKGFRGEEGPRGDLGDQGEKGVKGETGPVGAQGDVGAPGPEGIKGVKGIKGIKGQKGAFRNEFRLVKCVLDSQTNIQCLYQGLSYILTVLFEVYLCDDNVILPADCSFLG